MKRPPAKAGRKSSNAPGARRQSRHISDATKILLAVRSGGRCEFGGCNKFLFEHPLTLKDGNFSEHAHVVAFSELGPRGTEGQRPDDINSPDNLMLLCAVCHKEIDDRPGDYTRETLEGFKRNHEDRIKHVTGLGPDMRTTVVQLKAKIGGSAVDIPAAHIYEAVAPRYPTDKRGYVIDLTEYDREDRAEYYALAMDKIKKEVARLYDRGMEVESTRHISLFALAPIPILTFLGYSLSNKITVDFFQRHRSGEAWKWKTDGTPAEFKIEQRRPGADGSAVALMLSISGTISVDHLPADLEGQTPVYEISLKDQTPTPDILRQRDDLDRFRATYREFLAQLVRDHPQVRELHIFPATPAPIAVAVGHDLLPKVHPCLIVYDNDKIAGGFIKRIRINEHDSR